MSLEIRRATVADAAVLAGIKVRGWRWGYRGLLPTAFLDNLDVDKTESFLRAQLGPEDPRHTFIAVVDGEPRGFITCGPTDDATLPPDTGEIFSIYQEERAAGTGIGRALLSHAVDELVGRGFALAVLWVLEGNHRARRFYKLAGWALDGARKEDPRVDHVRHEVRYRRSFL